MDDDYFEVDMFICGEFVGRRKVHRNSIAGLLIAGNYAQGAQQTAEMVAKIEKQIASQPGRAERERPPVPKGP